MEAVVGHLEVTDHGTYDDVYLKPSTKIVIADEELEPLEAEPPLMLILVCDWLVTKMFGSCRAAPAPSRQGSVMSDV